MQRFEDIRAWQEARKLTKRVYELAGADPFVKEHLLQDQLVGAVLSSMTLIAAGTCCSSEEDLFRKLESARQSLVEVQSLLYTALDLGYIEPDVLREYYEQADRTKTSIDDLSAELQRDT
jgi:four helix bundle protein